MAKTLRRGTDFFWRDLSGLVLLGAGALGIGLTVNTLRQHSLALVYASPQVRLGESVARISSNPAGTGWDTFTPAQRRNIDLDEFQEFVSTHKGITIDARSKAVYELDHVPGAFNLPREDFENAYVEARPSLESEKERPIVVYCSEADCQDSELVADALSRLGYRHLFIYKEGWEEWSRAGLPHETGHSL